jgi:hypothetical protein
MIRNSHIRLAYIIIVAICCFLPKISTAEIIRVGVLDSFSYQNYVTTKYHTYYMQGFKLASLYAAKKNLVIKVKEFKYEEKGLSIIKTIDELNKWKPDVIIGPRDSNKFLILQKFIENTLTLSPFATSIDIEKMPSNFHSMTRLDNTSAKIYSIFSDKFYPKSNLYIIIEADCKSCNDVGRILANIKPGRSKVKYYLKENATNENITNLLDGYKEGDIIVLPNTAHSSAVLMVRITNYLKKDMIFLGGDGWGSWGDTEVGKIKANYPYEAYHITPWALEIKTSNMDNFKKKYQDVFHKPIENKLSFIVYQTVTAFIDAYVKYHNECRINNLRETLLCSYDKALDKNKNWYKSNQYVVFKIKENKNLIFSVINLEIS